MSHLSPGQVRQHGFDFLAGQHDGQARRLARADDLAQIAHLATDDVAIEEE